MRISGLLALGEAGFPTKSVWRGGLPHKVRLARRASQQNPFGVADSEINAFRVARQTYLRVNLPRQTRKGGKLATPNGFYENSSTRSTLWRERTHSKLFLTRQAPHEALCGDGQHSNAPWLDPSHKGVSSGEAPLVQRGRKQRWAFRGSAKIA